MVKRHESLAPISREHFAHLTFAQRLMKGRPKEVKSNWPGDDQFDKTLEVINQYYNIDLQNHFKNEEEILFKYYQEKLKQQNNSDQLLNEILKEHKIVRELFSELATVPKKEFKEKIFNLGKAIHDHVRKEERVLFNSIEQLLSDSELEEIGKILEERSVLRCSDLL